MASALVAAARIQDRPCFPGQGDQVNEVGPRVLHHQDLPAHCVEADIGVGGGVVNALKPG